MSTDARLNPSLPAYDATRPLRVEVVERRSRFWTWLAWGVAAFALLWAGAMTAAYSRFMSATPTMDERNFTYVDDATQAEKQLTATQKIAIITVDGVITHDDDFSKRQIEAVRKDDQVVGVVLRVDSPGGTVTGSNYLWHHLKKLRDDRKIPIVVSMGGITASGGYYISMAASKGDDVIWAEPTTWTGSIGVIIPHYEVATLMEKWGVVDDSIVSHRLKDAGSPTKKMTEEERALFQKLVDESFTDFKAIVQEGRPKMKPEDVDAAATGQIFTAKQALDRGLVDKLGYLEDAVKRAVELSGKNLDEVRAVKFKKPEGLFGDLGMLGRAPTDKGSSTQAALTETVRGLRNALVPRAYFLWPAALSHAGE